MADPDRTDDRSDADDTDRIGDDRTDTAIGRADVGRPADVDLGRGHGLAAREGVGGASTVEGAGEVVLASTVAVSAAVEEHPAAVYLARLAPSGRRSQRSALTTIAGLVTGGRADVVSLPWHQLRYVHTQAVRTLLVDRYAPATVNRQLSALRGVLKECWRLGLMSAEDYRRAADLDPVRGSTLPAGRALTAGELSALFTSCAAGAPGDVRDAALLAVLYGGGLRRAEAVALDVADYDPGQGQLSVRRGKGRKARLAYTTAGTGQALAAWLEVRGEVSGPLFCPVDKAGAVRVERLSGQAVRQLLLRRAARAGVAAFSPHDLRRTFISDLLDRGADIAVAQQLAGPANPATTVRYDRRPDAVKRRAVAVPFTGGRQEGGGGPVAMTVRTPRSVRRLLQQLTPPRPCPRTHRQQDAGRRSPDPVDGGPRRGEFRRGRGSQEEAPPPTVRSAPPHATRSALPAGRNRRGGRTRRGDLRHRTCRRQPAGPARWGWLRGSRVAGRDTTSAAAETPVSPSTSGGPTVPTFHRPPDRRVTPPSVPPARALTPTARRLHRLLADLDERQLDAVTNEWFAARLGVSARSVTTALSRLSAAGLITIESRRGHPRSDRAGRTIRLTGREGGERR